MKTLIYSYLSFEYLKILKQKYPPDKYLIDGPLNEEGLTGKSYFRVRDKTQPTIKQEGGMRLHYDKTLPSILKELTGEEGKLESFGEHKMAFEEALKASMLTPKNASTSF